MPVTSILMRNESAEGRWWTISDLPGAFSCNKHRQSHSHRWPIRPGPAFRGEGGAKYAFLPHFRRFTRINVAKNRGSNPSPVYILANPSADFVSALWPLAMAAGELPASAFEKTGLSKTSLVVFCLFSWSQKKGLGCY
jgi:hypothetical protein